jgi:hypothetical protein
LACHRFAIYPTQQQQRDGQKALTQGSVIIVGNFYERQALIWRTLKDEAEEL